MSKKNKNSFGSAVKTVRKAKERIEIINAKRERDGKEPLTKQQEIKIMKQENRKAKRERNIRAVFLALGITLGATGVKGVQLLNEGNSGIKQTQKEISIDTAKTDKNIKINNAKSDREIFINEYKVDVQYLGNETQKELEKATKEKVENLKTTDDVLEYLKQVYADEYNKANKTNIEKEQVNLYRSRINDRLYEDTAENGDRIFKETYSNREDRKYINTESGVITATIKEDEENSKRQKIVNVNNEYKTVYERNQDVDKYEANDLSKVGAIIDNGLNYSESLVQKDNSLNVNEEYKQNFINSIVNYKNNQIKQITQEDNER